MQVTHMCIPDFRDIAQNPTCLPYTPLSWVQVVEMWTPKKINTFWIGYHLKNISPSIIVVAEVKNEGIGLDLKK